MNDQQGNSLWEDGPRANCSDTLPYGHEFFNEIPVVMKVIIGICGGLTLITIIIFLDELRCLIKSNKHENILHKSIWLLGLYPVFSSTSLLAIVVPRSSLLDQLLASGYLAVVLYMFVNLMISYYGGEAAFLHIVTDTKIALRSPPLACCCCCCPMVLLNKKTYRIISAIVLQCAFVRPLIMYLSAVLWTEGLYVEGMLTKSTVNTIFGLTNTLSTLLAMYGLILIYRASKDHLKHYHIVPKFICFQLVLVASNLQILVFSILSSNDVFPCVGTLSPKIIGNVTHHGLLIFEMFLLALLARFFYMKTLRNDTSYTTEIVDANGINQGYNSTSNVANTTTRSNTENMSSA
ncbi:organic solute transporter subunit alpha [Patella vulgata]|uniref:organic solute transporter subunit alpha n=1 Tax=Patella vulgata TaxID=6465 RepID=UPI00217F400B|nr:organic solute transporter subunit alpha [Patella vulgata]